MNPFENPALVDGYEAWYETTGRRADHQEKALLHWQLSQFPPVSTLLEVGCGTGHFTRWFREQGLRVTGLDTSFPMLTQAARFDNCHIHKVVRFLYPFQTAVLTLRLLSQRLSLFLIRLWRWLRGCGWPVRG
jgi:SAM-dependent methyltransferase